ncbi:AraC family transcriptional regulator [Mannheimia indoligenes]|uniref:AraC family transcriptional regulator n=1 Tax=Mannheimia indoligenes TaxID=3103145 RepID=UPI002FE55DC7
MLIKNITHSTQRIGQAIAQLKQRFNEPLNMEALVGSVNMSPPSFYKHFRQITAISPLQYQKSLRLTEAKRLILQGNHSLGEIAHLVGYESQSQFSREYARLFGEPPLRDMQRLKDDEMKFGRMV